MNYLVEITEDKLEGLSEHLEKGLRYIGKAMQCIDTLKNEHMGLRKYKEWEDEEYGERMGNRMGYRGRYGSY